LQDDAAGEVVLALPQPRIARFVYLIDMYISYL
jgi:hypothetical protein